MKLARFAAQMALGSLNHRFTDILVRQDRCWKIAHVRAYDLQKTE